jgi:membrane associated rhomboid family serine protease
MSAPVEADAAVMSHCYRHPDRETGLACSNCGRPICTECMTQTPVGQRCPECMGGQKQRVLRPASMASARGPVTIAIMVACIAVFLGYAPGVSSGIFGGRSAALDRISLDGPDLAAGDWYRVVTSAFAHEGLLHIAFNMWVLYVIGTAVENRYGSIRYGLLYVVSLLGGSVGALLLSYNVYTVGASGAIFGVLGAMVVVEARNGLGFGGPAGRLLIINLFLTFTLSGISVGGHFGGLVAGAAAGWVLEEWPRRGLWPSARAGAALGGIAAVCVALIVWTVQRKAGLA